MKTIKFEEELKKIMPGYKWTVHKGRAHSRLGWTFIEATGVQSLKSRRLSTLLVRRAENADVEGKTLTVSVNGMPKWIAVKYRVKGYGGGVKAPRLYSTEAPTLTRALRQLQDYYEKQAYLYMSAAEHLHNGRKAVKE